MKPLKYLFISSMLFVATSCGNSWLDLEPSTSVDTETSIKILSDVEFTLNGIYSTMQSSDAYSGRLVYYGDVTGDDMQAVSSTKRVANYYRFNFTKDDNPSSHWSYLYSIIQNCNLILMNIDKLVIDEDDKAYRDDLKGEALAIRGLALFDLTRIFGYPYLKDNGASLGVPIIEGLSTIDSKPTRNTVAQCYTKIIDDLTQSLSLLGEKFNKGKINKWGAMVLLSRVYLYKGENANALKMASDAIIGAEKNKYALWTNEDYPTAWGEDASASKPGEVLFEIVNLTTDSPGKESMGYLNSYDGYDDMCITCSFYQFLKEDPKDIRLKLLSFDKKYYAYVNKYQPQREENIEDANIPLIRLSEAYLNAAEAAVKENDNDAAVKYLDPIVKRANPDNTVVGQTITLERVLNERRKELVAEGVSSALPATNEYGRASKPVAWALLARLYLNSAVYRGNVDTKYYTECITACKQVISNPAFYLEPEYAKLFNADNHKRTHEILFAMVCDATTSVTWGGGTYIICGSCGNSSTQDPAKYGLSNGWGMFRARGEMTAKFGDIATTKDSRAMFYTDGQAQFFTGAIDNQAEGYFFEKFSNLTDEGVAASNSAATGCSTDYPLLRLADIYLMAAEAQLRGGTGLSRAEALELVNQVRLRAYNQDESGKISDNDFTLDFILDERARELYLESVRRTDLIRFNKFVSADYIWQWKGGVLDGRAVNKKYNIYPIPDTDLTANPNLHNPLY